MIKEYYIIKYDGYRWYRTHVSPMILKDALEKAKTIENSDVVHNMWMTLLEEWPEPNFFKN